MYTVSHVPPSDRERLLEMASGAGTLTTKDVARAGIHSQQLSRLVREGRLERVARGLYRIPGQPVSEHHGLVLAARAVPRGVICLLSALAFHGVGTQLPFQVWMAIDRRARSPAVDYPPLRLLRFSSASLSAGVETHRIEGQAVKVYSVPKTLADLFKYRNKVGIEVALEALREAWRERRFTMDEIDRYAKVCRVERVMRPYLEALVG
jgi:predicted transcriptional regulator of viral defense system